MNCNYDVIILIIASDNTDYYINMQKVWKMYMNNHPKIKSFFIKENPNINHNLEVDDDTIHVKCKLSLIPGVLIKTIESFKYIYNNYNFKYIYRTNLSSFIDLNKLYSWTTNNFANYAAVIGEYQKISYGSGSGFFLSNEVVNYLINFKNIDYYKYIDDVAIGEIIYPKYSILFVNRNDFTDFDNKVITNDEIKNSDTFHYRCKNDNDMHETTYNLKKMYELIYKK
jgi:hypothetical protein